MKTSYKRRHQSTKKHSKHTKKHKKQKTVNVVTVRTKRENKVNAKKCFSKTSVQSFSEEGQIFCDDCKQIYKTSGG